MKTNNEYEPFGEEWKNEVKKIDKNTLITMWRKSLLELRDFKKTTEMVDRILLEEDMRLIFDAGADALYNTIDQNTGQCNDKEEYEKRFKNAHNKYSKIKYDNINNNDRAMGANNSHDDKKQIEEMKGALRFLCSKEHIEQDAYVAHIERYIKNFDL